MNMEEKGQDSRRNSRFIWSESYNLSDYITKAQFSEQLTDLERVNELSKPSLSKIFSQTLSNYSLIFKTLESIWKEKYCANESDSICTRIIETILVYLSYGELYMLESTHINWVTQTLSVFVVNDDISNVICTIKLDLNKIFNTDQLRSQISEKSLKTMIKDIQANSFDSESKQSRMEKSNCDIGKCFIGDFNDLLLLIPMKTSKNGNLQTFVIQCCMVVEYNENSEMVNKIELCCDSQGKILNIGSMHVHSAWFFYEDTSEMDNSSDDNDNDNDNDEDSDYSLNEQKENENENGRDQSNDNNDNINANGKRWNDSKRKDKVKHRTIFASSIYLEHSTQEGNVNLLSINRIPSNLDFNNNNNNDSNNDRNENYFFQNVHFESSVMKSYNVKCLFKVMDNIYHIIHSIKDTIYETPIDFTVAGIKSSITDTVTIDDSLISSNLKDQKIKQIIPIDARHYVNVLGCALVPSNNEKRQDDSTDDIDSNFKISFEQHKYDPNDKNDETTLANEMNNASSSSDDNDLTQSEIEKRKLNKRLRAASAHWRRLEQSLDFNNTMTMPNGQNMIDLLKSEHELNERKTSSLDKNGKKNNSSLYKRYTYSPSPRTQYGNQYGSQDTRITTSSLLHASMNEMNGKSNDNNSNNNNDYNNMIARRSSVIEKRSEIEKHSRRNSLIYSNKKTAFDVFDAVLFVVYGSGVIGTEMTDLCVAYLDSDYDIIKQTWIYLTPQKNGNNRNENVNNYFASEKHLPLKYCQKRTTVATTLTSNYIKQANDSKNNNSKTNKKGKKRKKKNVKRFINNLQKIEYIECNGDWILWVSCNYQTKRSSQTHLFEIKLNKFLNIKYIKRILTNKFYFKNSLRNGISNCIWKTHSNSNANNGNNDNDSNNGTQGNEYYIDCNPIIVNEIIDGELSSNLIDDNGKYFTNEFYSGPRDSMWHIDYNGDSMFDRRQTSIHHP